MSKSSATTIGLNVGGVNFSYMFQLACFAIKEIPGSKGPKLVDLGSAEGSAVWCHEDNVPGSQLLIQVAGTQDQLWLSAGEQAVLTNRKWSKWRHTPEMYKSLMDGTYQEKLVQGYLSITKKCTCGSQGSGICSSWCDSW